ncbi:MAG: nucleotidyltransferase domain-containing protein [Candidatus Aenigmatarchaeota archaeon]
MNKEEKTEKTKNEKRQETKEEILKKAEEFSKKILEKYGKYIKAIVMMGSVVREEFKPTSDIDIFVIVDDTQFNEVTPEFLDKLDEEMEKIAKEISEKISVQPSYTLTEFWDYARVAHPIIYNFIKEGLPLYDTGFFAPIKKLLEMGRIPTTREAIENYMEGAPKKIMRAKTVKLLMLAEDVYYAILNSAQAVLMFMGLSPPVPSKAYEEVKKFLVEPGILEPQYAEWLREIIEIRKKIEHKELMDASGQFVDEWLDRAEKFVDKMFALLNALEIRKREKILERTHEVMYKAALTALKSLNKNPKQEEIPVTFKQEFIDKKIIEPYYWDVWKRVEELKKKSDEKKIHEISDKEVYEMREYVRKLIHDLAKVLKDKEISEEGKK